MQHNYLEQLSTQCKSAYVTGNTIKYQRFYINKDLRFVRDTCTVTKTDHLCVNHVRRLLTLLFLLPAAALQVFDIVALYGFLEFVQRSAMIFLLKTFIHIVRHTHVLRFPGHHQPHGPETPKHITQIYSGEDPRDLLKMSLLQFG